MLGDSLRRRHGGPGQPPEEPQERPRESREARDSRGWRGRIRWWHWPLAALGVLVVSFAAGYLISTQILFPRPETAGTGIEVPTLHGRTLAEAEAAVTEVGLEVGDVREVASMQTEAGRVLAQDPIPGQQLRRGAAVSFSVSGGAPELRIPPLEGMGVGSARDLLEGVGFEVAIRQVESDELAGRIAGIQPPAGSVRTLPAVVTLLVSTGSVGAAEDSVAEGTGGAPEAASPAAAPAAGDTLPSAGAGAP